MQNRSLRNLFDAWKWSEIDVYKLFFGGSLEKSQKLEPAKISCHTVFSKTIFSKEKVCKEWCAHAIAWADYSTHVILLLSVSKIKSFSLLIVIKQMVNGSVGTDYLIIVRFPNISPPNRWRKKPSVKSPLQIKAPRGLVLGKLPSNTK